MSYTIQEYPVLEPLPLIHHHEQLPSGTIELGRLVDTSTGAHDLYVLAKHCDHLIILKSYHNVKTFEYYCDQYDFPLKALTWFPWALEEFRKPPAEGGLHAGAMISKDMDVDGEMLAVGSTTDGYFFINWSRNQQDPVSDYDPVNISLSWDFLYKLGFLDLWKKLGEKYRRGEI